MATSATAAYQSVNVTIDDFDALFVYSDDAAFNTNDPSRNESSFRTFHDATAHFTSNTSAYVNLSFVGTDIALYGASGPEYGNYQVVLDGQSTDATAYAANNGTLPYLLYSASGLNVSQPHQLTLRNLGNNGNETQGSRLLLDYATVTVPLAPEGATLTNTTVENDSSRLVYTGLWESNTSPFFSGGSTSYTNGTSASVQLTFNGSAIYVFGDANNDHYAFNVTLDGLTTTHHTPLGCGGPFEPHACEKIVPGLQYFAGPLDESHHSITVTNYVVPGLNYSSGSLCIHNPFRVPRFSSD
ncbi:hypothetical protein P389DRAFT_111002 [Cystobasidium minutum MCA 4210]|uniref:uncharacterized protein n=1 Tax=Cystobasidium minutum MCA 4210 TaxID=1397322 RepID=UPI0034CEC868|eukprot:jgi/Rhomi1/111002/CE111001_676